MTKSQAYAIITGLLLTGVVLAGILSFDHDLPGVVRSILLGLMMATAVVSGGLYGFTK